MSATSPDSARDTRPLTDPSDPLRVTMSCAKGDQHAPIRQGIERVRTRTIRVSGTSWRAINAKLDAAGYELADRDLRAPFFRICRDEHDESQRTPLGIEPEMTVTLDCALCGRDVTGGRTVVGESWADVNRKLDAMGFERAPTPHDDLRICHAVHGKGVDDDAMTADQARAVMESMATGSDE